MCSQTIAKQTVVVLAVLDGACVQMAEGWKLGRGGVVCGVVSRSSLLISSIAISISFLIYIHRKCVCEQYTLGQTIHLHRKAQHTHTATYTRSDMHACVIEENPFSKNEENTRLPIPVT